jgi:autotransporter-associated beta strand protein
MLQFTRHLNRVTRRHTLAALIGFSLATAAQAADQTWLDANANNNWNTTDANWVGPVVWTQNNSAIFGGTGETVALTEAISAAGLTFNSTGYTVSGNTLTLTGTPIISVTNSADSATLTSIVAGSVGFTKSGAGTLNLGSSTTNNTYSGQTIISAGTLKLNGLTNNNTVSGALGAGGAGNETIVQSGATLDLNGHQITNTEVIRIAGTGVGGNGALINSAATGSNLSNLNRLELTADATISSVQRFDIRGGTTPTLDLTLNTLTKTGASQFSVVNGTITSGNIIINQGVFSVEGTTAAARYGYRDRE